MGSYPGESDGSAPIETYLESMRTSRHVPMSSSLGTSGSFEARRSPNTQPKLGTNLPFPRVHTSPAPPRKSEVSKPQPPSTISAAVAAQSSKSVEPKNPFEEDEDKNNPFLEAEEVPPQPKNPFEEDDDYDSSLNPFAE